VERQGVVAFGAGKQAQAALFSISVSVASDKNTTVSDIVWRVDGLLSQHLEIQELDSESR
jgi:hypothetical protein